MKGVVISKLKRGPRVFELLFDAKRALDGAAFESAQVLFEFGKGLRLIRQSGAQRRRQTVEPAVEGFDAEFFCCQLFEPVKITLARFGNGKKGLGDQASK